jgi:hypothetical protein
MRLFSLRAFRENFNEDDEKGGHMLRLLLRELYKNFSAFSYDAYFHSARLLLRRSFSLRTFPDSAYFHSAYFPIARIKKRRRGKKWRLIKFL